MRPSSWSRAQVGAEVPMQVQCARTVSALLPAAELLLRGVLDVRHDHWQESLIGISLRKGMQQARCPS